MAQRKTSSDEVFEDPEAVQDLGPSGVRPLEPEPEVEQEYEGVDEVGPSPGEITQTTNLFTAPGTVTEVIEYEPEIIEGDEATYRIRLTQDTDSVFVGIDNLIPAMKKDVLYEVNQRVYDYLLPKGLIQGK